MANANQDTYEAKILETLIKNAERLAIVETELKQVKESITKVDNKISSKLNWLFGAVFAVGASILAALYVQPILTVLNR